MLTNFIQYMLLQWDENHLQVPLRLRNCGRKVCSIIPANILFLEHQKNLYNLFPLAIFLEPAAEMNITSFTKSQDSSISNVTKTNWIFSKCLSFHKLKLSNFTWMVYKNSNTELKTIQSSAICRHQKENVLTICVASPKTGEKERKGRFLKSYSA